MTEDRRHNRPGSARIIVVQQSPRTRFVISRTRFMISLELAIGHQRTRLAHTLDLFAEDSWLNVYRGKLEVRPPCAPTTRLEKRSAAVGQTLGDCSGPIAEGRLIPSRSGSYSSSPLDNLNDCRDDDDASSLGNLMGATAVATWDSESLLNPEPCNNPRR